MLSGITRLKEQNTAGGCMLQLVPVEQVDTVPDEVAGAIVDPITLITDASWIDVKPTRWTQEFTEQWVDMEGRQVAKAKLTFVVPKDRVLLLRPLWDMKPKRYLVLHHDLNSTMKLLGTKAQPAMVRMLTLGHGADPRGDRNQYLVEVTVTRSSACPFYLSDPPVSVPEGCPTLADLLAAETGADIWALLDGTQQAAVLVAAGVELVTGIRDNTPNAMTGGLIDPTP